jgi:hypothetical protein
MASIPFGKLQYHTSGKDHNLWRLHRVTGIDSTIMHGAASHHLVYKKPHISTAGGLTATCR